MRHPSLVIAAGAVATAGLALLAAEFTAAPLAQTIHDRAKVMLDEKGMKEVRLTFATRAGSPSRHAILTPVGNPGEGRRGRIAKALAAVPGVGGVFWTDGTMIAESGEAPVAPLHCQDDVEALLQARTIRFEESSASISPESGELLDEVATALRPCVGAIIAITGHTDSSGPPDVNRALSLARAIAVREALVSRGIPRQGLMTEGMGSQHPVEGLETTDPANRRIEFAVVAEVPLRPTPIDTPSAR
ncbi:OmpA family protein [Erythrobacter sp. LQ02-29]|uniref:OmpA family protein n=1 Tax=Erythrobacter sp. LQ02-29 TaxID=2920384 RepID=UPI001F4D8967|nr:OmpA family protein [Erythrobacter sp. LQ02-29]MCP9222646.1 OmpA family protein [Erythrobacter sp. LQ02-29]